MTSRTSFSSLYFEFCVHEVSRLKFGFRCLELELNLDLPLLLCFPPFKTRFPTSSNLSAMHFICSSHPRNSSNVTSWLFSAAQPWLWQGCTIDYPQLTARALVGKPSCRPGLSTWQLTARLGAVPPWPRRFHQTTSTNIIPSQGSTLFGSLNSSRSGRAKTRRSSCMKRILSMLPLSKHFHTSGVSPHEPILSPAETDISSLLRTY